MTVIQLSLNPPITARWHGGESHLAHIALNGKEVAVYTFGDMAGPTNAKEFHQWAKDYGDEVVETIVEGNF